MNKEPCISKNVFNQLKLLEEELREKTDDQESILEIFRKRYEYAINKIAEVYSYDNGKEKISFRYIRAADILLYDCEYISICPHLQFPANFSCFINNKITDLAYEFPIKWFFEDFEEELIKRKELCNQKIDNIYNSAIEKLTDEEYNAIEAHILGELK